MQTVKAAIFDVDGTLFDYRHQKIHDSTVSAIQRLRDAGVLIVIASGRSYPLLGTECLEKIPADYYVLANGHSVLDGSGREVFSRRFTFEQTQRVVDLAKRFEDGLMLKYNHFSCIYSRYDEMFSVFSNIGLSQNDFRSCPSMDYHKQELPIGFTIRGNPEMKQELLKHPRDYRVELFFDDCECDVFSPDTNKMLALGQLAHLLELDPKQCIAYGDSRNDLEMIHWAGVGVAMGNACDQLKEAADWVCAPSWEDGIAISLQTLLPGQSRTQKVT